MQTDRTIYRSCVTQKCEHMAYIRQQERTIEWDPRNVETKTLRTQLLKQQEEYSITSENGVNGGYKNDKYIGYQREGREKDR